MLPETDHCNKHGYIQPVIPGTGEWFYHVLPTQIMSCMDVIYHIVDFKWCQLQNGDWSNQLRVIFCEIEIQAKLKRWSNQPKLSDMIDIINTNWSSLWYTIPYYTEDFNTWTTCFTNTRCASHGGFTRKIFKHAGPKMIWWPFCGPKMIPLAKPWFSVFATRIAPIMWLKQY